MLPKLINFKEIEKYIEREVFLQWFVLAFNAGCINAGGFLATGRFVTHVTGFATLFGVDVYEGKWMAGIGILSVPVFFMLGAFLAGLFIDRRLHHGKRPLFEVVLGIEASCLLYAALAGERNEFGNFLNNTDIRANYFLLGALCLASGIQNAAVTSSSGTAVRTTHLTGLTTDIGLGIARLFTFSPQDPRFTKEIAISSVRVGTVLFFVGGSVIGASMFYLLEFKGFLLSAAIAALTAWNGRKMKFAPHAQFRNSI